MLKKGWEKYRFKNQATKTFVCGARGIFIENRQEIKYLKIGRKQLNLHIVGESFYLPQSNFEASSLLYAPLVFDNRGDWIHHVGTVLQTNHPYSQ